MDHLADVRRDTALFVAAINDLLATMDPDSATHAALAAHLAELESASVLRVWNIQAGRLIGAIRAEME